MQTEAEVRSSARPDDQRPILVATDVTKTYRTGAETVVALRDIDLEVAAGEFVAVMGPSGSGKTTMLNCLSGLDEIDAGAVEVDGRDLGAMSDAERTKHRASTMGFIFQAFNLIPVFSSTENVELPLLLAGAPVEAAVAGANIKGTDGTLPLALSLIHI